MLSTNDCDYDYDCDYDFYYGKFSTIKGMPRDIYLTPKKPKTAQVPKAPVKAGKPVAIKKNRMKEQVKKLKRRLASEFAETGAKRYRRLKKLQSKAKNARVTREIARADFGVSRPSALARVQPSKLDEFEEDEFEKDEFEKDEFEKDEPFVISKQVSTKKITEFRDKFFDTHRATGLWYSAVSNYFLEQFKKHLANPEHVADVISIEGLLSFCPGSERIATPITQNFGWGHCTRYLIGRFPASETNQEWFGIWTYVNGSCSFCDSDLAISGSIESYGFLKQLEITGFDLLDKLRRVQKFPSLSSMLIEFVESGYDEELTAELHRKLSKKEAEPSEPAESTGYEPDLSDFDGLEDGEVSDFEPEPTPVQVRELPLGVVQMIGAGGLYTLRDIMDAAGVQGMEGVSAGDLGRELKILFGSRLREFRRVYRPSGAIRVALYESYEIETIVRFLLERV